MIVESYWAPARQAERSQLHRLAGEYNAHGDIDQDPVFHEQHRHGMFIGGWWD